MASVKLIKTVHFMVLAEVQKMLHSCESDKELSFVCRYEQFAASLKKSDVLTVESVFASILKQLRGFGKESVEKVKMRFKSFAQFYRFLNSRSRDLQQIRDFLANFSEPQQQRLVKQFVVNAPDAL